MGSLWEALTGPDVVLEDAVLQGHAVIVKDGLFDAIVPVGHVPSSVPIRDLGSGLLTPGLVDIHSHGAAGCGFSGSDAAGYRTGVTRLLDAGVTTVLPTLASASLASFEQSLDYISGLQDVAGLPRIPGAHLEGPYFAPAQRGALDATSLRRPDDGTVERLLEHRDAIRMVSFAPELPGALRLTEQLVDNGIVAAAGHSDGRDEDLYACQRAGLSHVIHIFSGQSTTVRHGPWRRPGMVEGSLASSGLTVEMIADGKHLPATLMKIAYRCLAGRLCLVSDSTPGAGLGDGARYNLAGKEYVVVDGVGMTLDQKAFAGSTTLISDMIPITMASLGIGLAEAVAMASSVPARAMGLHDVGRISVGAKADLVLFDTDLKVRNVALGGEWRITNQ